MHDEFVMVKAGISGVTCPFMHTIAWSYSRYDGTPYVSATRTFSLEGTSTVTGNFAEATITVKSPTGVDFSSITGNT